MSTAAVLVILALAELDTREFYRAALSRAGFDVVTASPATALNAARHLRPGAIVIDAECEDGLCACRDFKADAAVARIPLIALAGPDQQGLDESCNIVLPIDCLDTELIDTIDRLLVERDRNG